ncbi:MAG: hypothetical protein WCK02_00475 [Bacteroidota bacterium]
MKKIAAVCLLLIAFYSMLSFVVFKMQQFAIYREVKRLVKTNVEESKLAHFEFSEKQFKQLDWEKPDKEFKLNGNMYDVIKKKITNGKIQLACIHDTQEEALIESYLDANNHQLNPNKNKTKNIKNISSRISPFLITEKIIIQKSIANTFKCKVIHNQLYVNVFLTINSPPPEFL